MMVIMERTKSKIPGSFLLQLHEVADDIHYVGCILYSPFGRVVDSHVVLQLKKYIYLEAVGMYMRACARREAIRIHIQPHVRVRGPIPSHGHMGRGAASRVRAGVYEYIPHTHTRERLVRMVPAPLIRRMVE